MRPAYFLLCCSLLAFPQDDAPRRSVTDPGVVTTRQQITPAGVSTVFTGRVYGVTFGETANEIWVLGASEIYRLDWRSNKVLKSARLGGNPGLQSLRYDRERKRVMFGETSRGAGVQLVATDGERRLVLGRDLGSHLSANFDATSNLAVAPMTANNKLAVVDVQSGTVKGLVATGIAPFGAALSRDGTVAYVSNWGGRLPRQGERTATTGRAPDADRVVIDERGIASTGTVTRIDVAKLSATHTIPVGLHPTAMAWDEARQLLYVANANSDSLSVVDTRKQAVVRTIAIQPFAEPVKGIAPTALALAPDGSRLFVACGGINAVAIIDTAKARVEGMIPAAWYPNAIAVSEDGSKIAVTALLGAGSGWREEPRKRFVHSYRGSVHVVDVPSPSQLASYTTAVAENTRLPLAGASVARSQPAPAGKPVAIPVRSGDPSLIEHVVFIIKENRTYDQVLGALERGNGDPSLVMFGRDVTPNHHKLAEEFVLLDNFYATGGNSADGHQWVTQANETAYCLWPGYAGRSYPFDGSDPIAYASGGFLWDYALARRKTVRVYGEYVPALREKTDRHALLERWRNGESFSAEWNASSPIPSLDRSLARQFPSYTTAIPDVVRASIFLEDFRRMEKEGSLPNLLMIQLPSDHTNGASPGASTPEAMVADNDLALGQIVEALSKSRFWPKMAIFVVEDDAQNGVDHVDGHRTVALAISPYVRRGHIDSTFYSTQSMVKTIELILGLPTMSLFDLIAHDMRLSFTDTPDPAPYTAVQPKQSLFDRNPPLSALRGEARKAAAASVKMNFNVPDAAPSDRLNRILWGAVRGWDKPYPGTRSAVFAPMTLDIDDDDRE